MSEDTASEQLPLAGIRVLDVGSFIAAPAAATAMGGGHANERLNPSSSIEAPDAA